MKTEPFCGAAEKFQVLETALLERMNKRLELHAGVRYVLGRFARVPHIRSVVDVAREAGLSRRRFAPTSEFGHTAISQGADSRVRKIGVTI